MAEKRVGTISGWTDISAGLSTFRLRPHEGTSFPPYQAGQYIALTRENCRLTSKIKDADGQVTFTSVVGADGGPKMGPVTHSYSIASAPFETEESGELEIYVTLEKIGEGQQGRFTESLFSAAPHVGDTLGYVDRIVGNFTLAHRAAAAEHVVMVGTGTGLAPFVGMMKQTAHEARAGQKATARYTLIHTNRTTGELAYDPELRGLNAESIPGFDFQYVPSVSRPATLDAADPELSTGRANNLLRKVLGLKTRETEIVEEVRAAGGDATAAEQAALKSTAPRLAAAIDGSALRERMPSGRTTVLTCGNADLMEDIKRICEAANFKFEMEEW